MVDHELKTWSKYEISTLINTEYRAKFEAMQQRLAELEKRVEALEAKARNDQNIEDQG